MLIVMTATLSVPVSDLDPFSLEFLGDPYPGHTAMREAGPVVLLERYGIYASARHAPVRAAFLDPDAFCSSAGVGISDFRKEEPWRPPSLLLEADPPEHARARRVVTGVLSAAAVRRLTATFEAAADELVARLAHGEPFDALADLAIAYPLQVFSDAVGLPAQGRSNLLAYGRMVFNTFGPRNTLFEQAVADAGPVREWIMDHCRPENLSRDGMGAEIHARAAAEGFSEQEGGMLVRSFLSAGIDTTVHGLGNALLCFAEHPEQYALLRADPERARAAYEEVLRFEAPVQNVLPHDHPGRGARRGPDPGRGEGAAVPRRRRPRPPALARARHVRHHPPRHRPPRVRFRDPRLRGDGDGPPGGRGGAGRTHAPRVRDRAHQ